MILGPHSGVDVLFENKIDDEGVETWINADLIAVVEAEGMLSSIRRLTGHDSSSWIFGWGPNKGQIGTDLDSIHRFSLRNVGIAGLAILHLRPAKTTEHPILPTEESALFGEQSPHMLSVPSIGKKLTLHGSGFGLIAPSVLINNISQGVVANIVHPYRAARRVDEQANSLVLTDAKFLPGMEGGAVSWDETGELAGLSMLPIRRTDGEPVDISLVIPVACLISAISPYISVSRQPLLPKHIDSLNKTTLIDARQAVVMVQVGQTWASGVVISKHGHILTNAHVFTSFLDNISNRTWPNLRSGISLRVRIDSPQQQQWVDDCEVVFVSESCWDVALIKIPETCVLKGFLPFLPLRTKDELSRVKPLKKGSPLFAIGHGIFGPSSGILPLITSGICSKVVTYNQQPVMLLSSAPVHRGNSGGVLITTDGHFAGLVTGNGKTSTGRTITHLNFAIPLEALTDAVNAYLVDENRNWLDKLNMPPPRIGDIWSLRGTAPAWEPIEKAPSKL
ncbi:peroxisomal leader peptide-processing protease [Entomortierella parvispora]|uniref:Peroxisomal leader peptide-processing protease n=1 Tax=Entomortierella parvispora TaxID=205924 RepID=A0A9P3HCH6_9FUNG|nr:peroxisomal leader peptide-processing protease [Entomortierella parvispora]